MTILSIYKVRNQRSGHGHLLVHLKVVSKTNLDFWHKNFNFFAILVEKSYKKKVIKLEKRSKTPHKLNLVDIYRSPIYLSVFALNIM